MTIFLAGGTGAVGRRLVPRLVADRHRVVATTTSRGKLDGLRAMGAEPVLLDALNREAVLAAVAAARPDAIVHQATALASMRNLKRFDEEFAASNRLRTEGTAHLLEAARAVGVTRFVAQSYTGWPNIREGGRVKTETDPLDPHPPPTMRRSLDAMRQLEAIVVGVAAATGPDATAAGATGAGGTAAGGTAAGVTAAGVTAAGATGAGVTEAGATEAGMTGAGANVPPPTAWGMTGVVLRYGSFYGPGTSLGADGDIVALIRKRMFPIVGSGAGVWSFVHIDDVAQATRLAITDAPAGIFNIVDDEPAEVSVWLPELARTVGAKPPRRLPVWLGRLLLGDAGVSMMTSIRGSSNEKARRMLDWQPLYPTWRDGFRRGLA